MNKRVVILWLCFFVWTVSLMAQDVPAGVVAAFKKGNSQELNGYLSDKCRQPSGREKDGIFLFRQSGERFYGESPGKAQ